MRSALDDELVATAPNQRNWRGIILALMVIAFISVMIIIAAYILTPPATTRKVTGRRLTLDDVLDKSLQPQRFNGSWISGDELVFLDESGGISVLDCNTRKQKSLVSNYTLKQWDIDRFWLSPDQKFVLIKHDTRQVYRHSTLAKYTVYDVVKGSSKQLTPNPEQSAQPDLNWVSWIPFNPAVSDRGHALLMLHNGDIYYQPAADNQSVQRITNSGVPGVVTNGMADWVYEEEILEQSEAVWFNPGGTVLVYASFNDTEVDAVPISGYNLLENEADIKWLRFPKAGGVNPVVTLWVVDLTKINTGTRQELKPPPDLINKDYYLNDVVWVNDGTVAVTWMNRLQSSAYITECPVTLGYCSETHIHERPESGWLDRQRAPLYASTGNTYLTILSTQDAKTGGFRHLYKHATNPRRLVPLTSGSYEVTELLAWDEPRRLIYFIADTATSVGQRHLYRINVTSDTYKYDPECLTCRLNTSANTCDYVRIKISPSYDYYIQECLGTGVPWTRVFSLPDNKHVFNLTDNPLIRESVEQIAMPVIEIRSVPLPRGVNASVQLQLPPILDKQSFVTYPVILQIYGGPGSQQVRPVWSLDWSSYMVSGEYFIYIRIDASGSGFRGDRLKHNIYKKLGTQEIDDQLYVLRQLLETEFYMDQERVMVWGWSYGGYAAAMALARDADHLLSGAISVAPVSDWRLYDSVYTERYMGQPGPQGNYRGYEEADLTSRASKLVGRSLMVVHGTADDNVHLQHSMVLSQALVKTGALFRQQIYPNESHSLSGVKRHLYTLMHEFIEQTYLPPSDVIDLALVKYFKKKNRQ